MVELLLSDNAMRKSLIAIGAALLLVGAGCGGAGAARSLDLAAQKAEEVQVAVNALVAAGEALDEEAIQALVSVPIDDGVAFYGVSGYFSETSKDIDWNVSLWSDNNNTAELISKDGITLGTWSKDASGVWKATSAFWFE